MAEHEDGVPGEKQEHVRHTRQEELDHDFAQGHPDYVTDEEETPQSHFPQGHPGYIHDDTAEEYEMAQGHPGHQDAEGHEIHNQAWDREERDEAARHEKHEKHEHHGFLHRKDHGGSHQAEEK